MNNSVPWPNEISVGLNETFALSQKFNDTGSLSDIISEAIEPCVSVIYCRC